MKKIIISAVAALGIIGGAAACTSTSSPAPVKTAPSAPASSPATPSPAAPTIPAGSDIQTWASANYAAVQAVDTDVTNGNVDQAVAEWDAIPSPPVDAADWNRATDDLNAFQVAYDSGDSAAATQAATAFATDLSAWTSALGYTGQ